METAYLMSKQLINEKCKSNDPVYPMMVTAFSLLLYKYKDNVDIVKNVFRNTNIYINTKSVREILQDEEIDVVSFNEKENVIEKGGVNTTYGLSSNGNYYLFGDDDFIKEKDNSFVVCTSACSKVMLLNTFIHEFNHLIKSYIEVSSDNDIFSYTTRNGLSYYRCSYNKKKDILYEATFFETFDEVINTIQTTEMLQNIEILDSFCEKEIKEYLDSLDKDEISYDFGYNLCVKVFRPLWSNDYFRSLVEDNALVGNIDVIGEEFDKILGKNSFIRFTDLLDNLDDLDNSKHNYFRTMIVKNKINDMINEYNKRTNFIYTK